MLFILIALILYLAANGWVYYHGHIALQGFPLSVRIGFGIVFWAVALSFILFILLYPIINQTFMCNPFSFA